MMASVNYGIIDTGYADKDTSSGTKFDVINSGNEVLIYGIKLTYTGGANLDDSPTPTSFSLAAVNTTSISNNIITLEAQFNKSDATQRAYLQNLFSMKNTKGVKIFYYGSTTDGFYTTPNLWGTTDTDHSSSGGYVSGTTPHLHVFVKGVVVNEDNGNINGLIKVNITMVETG